MRHLKSVKTQTERARRMYVSLSKNDETIAALRQELMGARQQTQEVLTPYLEELDHAQKVAAEIEALEVDPEHEELKLQLDRLSSKPRHPVR